MQNGGVHFVSNSGGVYYFRGSSLFIWLELLQDIFLQFSQEIVGQVSKELLSQFLFGHYFFASIFQ